MTKPLAWYQQTRGHFYGWLDGVGVVELGHGKPSTASSRSVQPVERWEEFGLLAEERRQVGRSYASSVAD